jgi:acetyl-CoA carboxylase biotin carboxyl carrier protein
MDKSLVAGLVELFDRSSLTELEFEGEGFRLRLSRNPETKEPSAAPQARAHSVSVKPAAVEAAPPKPVRRITAGVAGTFYRSPGPGQAPFVEVGATVGDGQPLGVVEAMKMLNAVEAPCAGVVRSIEVEDGAMVSADDVLMVIEPAGS